MTDATQDRAANPLPTYKVTLQRGQSVLSEDFGDKWAAADWLLRELGISATTTLGEDRR